MGPITSFADLWAAAKRQLGLMLLVIALGLPVVYWYAVTRPRVFEAAAVAVIEGPAIGESDADPGLTSRLNEIQQTILARDRLADFADQFDLFPMAPSEVVRVDLTRAAITIGSFSDNVAQAGRPTGLRIAVRLEDPVQAASFANALAEAFLDEDVRRARLRLDAAIERSSETHQYLSGEQIRVESEIRALEAEISDFRKANANSLPENIEDQQQRRLTLEQGRVALEREIAYYERANSPFRTEVTERHRAGLRAEIQSVLDELAQIDAALSSAPEVERQLSEYDREIQGLQAELAAISTTRTQVSLDQQLSGRDEYRLTLSEAAVSPEFPISRSRRKLMLAGVVAVMGVAAGLALARELLQKSIRSAAQMRQQLDIEPVVVIPFITSREMALRRLGYGAFFLGVLLLTIFAGAAVLAEGVG